MRPSSFPSARLPMALAPWYALSALVTIACWALAVRRSRRARRAWEGGSGRALTRAGGGSATKGGLVSGAGSSPRTHPRDTDLTFDEGAHAYYVRGRRLRSVTDVVAAAFPTFDAESVAERIVRSHRSQSDPTYAYYGMSQADVLASWQGKGDGAQALGTALHGEIERALAGEELGPEASRVGPEFDHFRAYRRDYAGHTVVRTEWRIYDSEKGLAGTVDAVFRDLEGRYVLVDWKRSREITRENRWEHGYGPVAHLPHTNYWHYALQLNLYASILERHYGIAIGAMRLVVLHPSNASYDLHDVPRLTAEVEALLPA